MKRLLALLAFLPALAFAGATIGSSSGGGGGSGFPITIGSTPVAASSTTTTIAGLTLTTPNLGTPSTLTLTNATGLPPAGVTGTAAVLGANTFTGTQTFSGSTAEQIPSSVTTGLQLFSTSTIVTNYSDLQILYGSSAYQIGAVTVGTSAYAPLNFYTESANAGAYFSRLDLLNVSGSPLLRQGLYTTATGTTLAGNGGSNGVPYAAFGYIDNTASSGTIPVLAVLPTIAQSGTAGYQALKISVVETSTGSGVKYPVDVLTGSAGTTDVFHVDDNGVATAGGLAETGSTYAGTVTLTAGSGTITSAAITTSSVIALSVATTGGTPGTYTPRVNVSAGSATVTGLSTDTSTYNWRLIQ